jgi:hypothetical protein
LRGLLITEVQLNGNYQIGSLVSPKREVSWQRCPLRDIHYMYSRTSLLRTPMGLRNGPSLRGVPIIEAKLNGNYQIGSLVSLIEVSSWQRFHCTLAA